MKKSSITIGEGSPPKSIGFKRENPIVLCSYIDRLEVSFSTKNESKFREIISSNSLIIGDGIKIYRDNKKDHKTYKGPIFSCSGITLYTSSGYQKRLYENRRMLLVLHGEFCSKLKNDEKLVEIFEKIEVQWELSKPIISRADIALDFIKWSMTRKDMNKFYTQLKSINIIPTMIESPIETVTFGDRKRLQVCFYNKKIQLEKNGKSIIDMYPELDKNHSLWRMEIRSRTKWLRDKGIQSLNDLLNCKEDLIFKVMTYVIYHQGRTKKMSKKWQFMINQIKTGGNIMKPNFVSSFNRYSESRAISGYLARYSSFVDIEDPIEAIKSVLDDLLASGTSWSEVLSEKQKANNLKIKD